jgi:hypothetical protein
MGYDTTPMLKIFPNLSRSNCLFFVIYTVIVIETRLTAALNSTFTFVDEGGLEAGISSGRGGESDLTYDREWVLADYVQI